MLTREFNSSALASSKRRAECKFYRPTYSNSSRRAMPLCDLHSTQMRANRFCGPSPMRYSINRSSGVLSRGRIGRGSGGPGAGPYTGTHK